MIWIQTGDEDVATWMWKWTAPSTVEVDGRRRLWEKKVHGSCRRAVKDETFGTPGLVTCNVFVQLSVSESMNLFLRLLSCFQDPRFGRAVSPRNIVPPRLLNHSYQTAARDFGLERLFGAVVSDSGPAAVSTASATPMATVGLLSAEPPSSIAAIRCLSSSSYDERLLIISICCLIRTVCFSTTSFTDGDTACFSGRERFIRLIRGPPVTASRCHERPCFLTNRTAS
ncbi:hypothetical protein PR003_g29114 [Phytophthora rubi]|uniref:Uncharacterized protein n=1 Tax=Phytophthora rubi TaxID=129364 RepID=A0A6A4BP96_9STRA|nr:hypothetical protein PR003_g29114 [Phytophthora rubi]